MFLDESLSLEIKFIANNEFVQFQTWDFPGDYDFDSAACFLCSFPRLFRRQTPHTLLCRHNDVWRHRSYRRRHFPLSRRHCVCHRCTGVHVFRVSRSCALDLTCSPFQDEESYGDAIEQLHETMKRVMRINPSLHFEIFIHKLDGDRFAATDHKLGQFGLVLLSPPVVTVNQNRQNASEKSSSELRKSCMDCHPSFRIT
jgi:Ras-related GTP-binding protein C/D